MTRQCDVCGKPFEAKKPQARFCGATCRKRHSRGAGKAPAAPKTSPPPQPVASGVTPQSETHILVPQVGLIASVVNDLTAAGRMQSVLGQQALRMAIRLETSTVDTGAGLVSLSKELRALMSLALAGAEDETDPVDELKSRRDEKRRTAAG